MHSITLRRMEQFRRRRNWLLIARGLAVAAVMLLAASIACAFVDAWWVLPLSSRWAMAGVVYSIAGLAFVALVVRPWLKAKSQHWLAEHLENIEPRLKERLVAAVELEQQPVKLGSPAFHEALQRNVAKRMESVEVSKLLPWTLIRVWLWLLVGALLLVGILCSIPSLYMPTRLGRVLLPMVNIGRVSRFAIEVVQPTSETRFVPENDIFAVQAIVYGQSPDTVQLEIVHGNDGSETSRLIPMHLPFNLEQPTSNSDVVSERMDKSPTPGEANAPAQESNKREQKHLFQAHYTPPLGKNRFRVVAEDAVSAWHDFTTVPRPRVMMFDIDYDFPDYTQLPNEKTQSENGDLQALSGTIAKLSIETNQSKVDGEIVIQPKDKSRTSENGDTRIALERSGEGKLTATIPIEFNANYRVELTAVETGFNNEFASGYRILALEDKSPRVHWQTPNQMNVPVKPDELLDMAVFVEDEIPVASVTQRIRVGRGDWQVIDRPLPTKPADSVSFRTDVLPLNVQPGDIVQTEIVVVDRRGQTTTTDPIELVISSVTLDPKRQDLLKKRSEIVNMIEAFEESLGVLSAEVDQARETLKQQPKSELAKKQVTEAIERFGNSTQLEAARIRQRIVEQFPDIKNTVASEENELIARNLSRIEDESVPKLATLLKELNDAKLTEASKQISQIVSSTSNLSKRTRDLVSHDVINQVGQDLKVLHGYQQDLKNTLHSLEPEQFRRRQALVARQMQDLAEMLRENLPTLRNRGSKTGKDWLDWLDSQANRIIETTGRPDRKRPTKMSASEREQLAENVLSELRKHQNSGRIDEQIAAEQLKARDNLLDNAGSPSTVIAQLADSVRKFADPRTQAVSDESIIDLDLPAIDQLSAHREMQQARNDGDNQYVADLGEAYRAANAIARERQLDPQSTVDKLNRLQQNMAKLDALHSAQQTLKTLNQIYDIERWAAGTLQAQFEQPRNWEAFQQQLVNAAKALRKAGVDAPTIASLEEALKGEALKRVDEKIAPRRWSSDSLASAAPEIELFRKELVDSIAALNEAARDARHELATLSPSVSQLARDAAKQIQQTANQTDQLAQAVEQNQVPDIRPRLQQIDQAIQANDPPMKQFRDGLADLASRQDVMKDTDSQIARNADAAIDFTNKARQRMVESFESVKQSEAANSSQSLAASADVQSDAARSMEKLAEHFEKLAALQNTPSGPRTDQAPPPESIAKLSDEMAANAELNQAHNDAERLRRLATVDPKRVMAELEKELKRNQPMQAELSEIAREAARDALESLEATAVEENLLNTQLENSDASFKAIKEQLAFEISQSVQAADKITQSLAPRLKATAERAFDRDTAKLSEQMTNELSKKAQKPRGIRATDSIEQLLEAAKELHTALDVYGGVTNRQAQALSATADKLDKASDAQRQQLKREMSDWQSKYRDEDIRRAFAEARDLEPIATNARQKVKHAQEKIDHLEKNLNDAQKQLLEQPSDQKLKTSVAEQMATLSMARRDLATANAEEGFLNERLDSMKKHREEVQMETSKPFMKPNAAAELGARVARNAAQSASSTAERLAEAIARAQQAAPPESSLSTITEASKEQTKLQSNVMNAAEGLARAARHEERMNQSSQSDMLQQQAAQVANLAQGSVKNASEQLSNAAQSSGSQPANSSIDSQSTARSQQALQAAEGELRKQAEALNAAISGKSSQMNKESRTSNEGSQSALLSPQEMARMLDELDHLLNMPKEGQQQAQSGQQNSKSGESSSNQAKSSAQGAPSPSSPKDASQTLAEAADRLTAEMNQQRQAMESTSQAVPGTGSSESQSRSSQQSSKSTAGFVPSVEILNIEDWGKLRQQSAEDAREGSRDEIPAPYRIQIEEYFRRLSKRRESTP